jgi:hypothetical protein
MERLTFFFREKKDILLDLMDGMVGVDVGWGEEEGESRAKGGTGPACESQARFSPNSLSKTLNRARLLPVYSHPFPRYLFATPPSAVHHSFQLMMSLSSSES